MDIQIQRMNGLGNRFAIIDMRALEAMNQADKSALARRVGGCDQALFLLPPRAGGDLLMEIFNKDGSEAEACGNGTRCVAWAEMRRLGRADILIETRAGVLACREIGADGANIDTHIEVDMGVPRFGWDEIKLATPHADTAWLEVPAAPASLGLGTALNIGNPHIVFFPQDEAGIDGLDIEQIGMSLEHDPLFPEGINITLAEQKALDHLKIKVWERGAGATRACGTAACACLVAAHRRKMDIARAAKIEMPGGILNVCWREKDGHVLMAGAVIWDGEEIINVAP